MNGPRAADRGLAFFRVAALCAMAAVGGCSAATPQPDAELDRYATRYVQLTAALVKRDPDSASGDTAAPTFTNRDAGSSLGLADIAVQAQTLAGELRTLAQPGDRSRQEWLVSQLTAVSARASIQSGVRMNYPRELELLFGIEPPADIGPDVAAARDAIDSLLPGTGTAAARLSKFEDSVEVPRDRLQAVFLRAMDECRARTRARVSLPADERIEARLVTGVVWSAFSTYLGGGHSRIVVNAALPLTVDRVLELACHEGYPGHHVINTLRDQRAAGGRLELTAVPLFSPESFAAESVASNAASLVFTDEERVAFERDVLYPLAGLPPVEATRHVQVARLLDRVSPAVGVHLSRYLAGSRDFIETSWALQSEALMAHPQATLLFANQFRGFALAYTRSSDHPGDMWSRYEALLKGAVSTNAVTRRVWRATG